MCRVCKQLQAWAFHQGHPRAFSSTQNLLRDTFCILHQHFSHSLFLLKYITVPWTHISDSHSCLQLPYETLLATPQTALPPQPVYVMIYIVRYIVLDALFLVQTFIDFYFLTSTLSSQFTNILVFQHEIKLYRKILYVRKESSILWQRTF